MEKPQPVTDRHEKKALREGFIRDLEGIFLGEKLRLDIRDESTGKAIVPKGKKISKKLIRALADAHEHLDIDPSTERIALMERVMKYQRKLSGEDKTGYPPKPYWM